MIRNKTRVVLAENGWSMRELAKQSGVHYTTIRHFCRPWPTRIEASVLAAVCKTLEVQPGVLLFYVPDADRKG